MWSTPSIPYMSPAAIGWIMVSPRGSSSDRKRSPMALNMASGHPSPDEELTDTVAPPGMPAAASSSEIHFDRVIARPDAISIVGNLNRLALLRRFTHGKGHRQRSDAVGAGSRRLPFAAHGRVEAAHRSLVKVLMLDRNCLFAAIAENGHGSDRPLRHHIPAVDRTLGPVHL